VLAALPKSLQGKAKADLQAIWMADTHKVKWTPKTGQQFKLASEPKGA
jgi:hypothetical protein